MTPDKI